ncbi:MAG: hypothetical protein K0V04_17530 [Deltaproteobacteria bacterium]|nr:hypothetical protein [Deltaproteobacteria bacterium]
MITVRRSDTGAHVLIHEPSQTVMVGEDLAATYAKMEQHLGEHPTLASASDTAARAPQTNPRWAWLVGLGAVALLPLLWLAVLHYTLGGLIDELRAAPPAATDSEQVQDLQAQLSALEQNVSRLEDALGRARVGAATDAAATKTPPRRPADRSRPTPPVDKAQDAERARDDKARAAMIDRRRQAAADQDDADQP